MFQAIYIKAQIKFDILTISVERAAHLQWSYIHWYAKGWLLYMCQIT